ARSLELAQEAGAAGEEASIRRLLAARSFHHPHAFLNHNDNVLATAVGPDGAAILTGCKDHNAYLWNAVSGELIATLKGHAGPVNAVAFAPDGKHVATGCKDKTTRLWNVATG